MSNKIRHPDKWLSDVVTKMPDRQSLETLRDVKAATKDERPPDLEGKPVQVRAAQFFRRP